MKNIKLLLLSIVSLFGTIGMAQTNNTSCADMAPICTDELLVFDINATGGGLAPGNFYDCLVPTVGTNWFYLKIGTGGNLDMTMTAPVDLDFVLWGPFADLAAAQAACGSLGQNTTPPSTVDCGALGGTTESINISGANTGDVYVLLITIPTGSSSTTFELTLDPSSTGSTDCSVVLPPCDSDPGTFTLIKNGDFANPTTSPISLCAGQTFQILSNADYTLPGDTISYANGGDSAYTAMMMFLLYDAPPQLNTNPILDPGFTGVIIPSDSLLDTNKVTTSIYLDSLDINCGTIWFVPVAGDDGIGLNNNVAGVGDNGQVNFDLDGNFCFILGDAIEVKYNCEIVVNSTIVCPGTKNTDPSSIDININGGEGMVTIGNWKDGTLNPPTTVTTPTAISLLNIFHLDTVEMSFTDEEGCVDSVKINFSKPQFLDVTVSPAASCGALGYVAVEGDPATGNGGIASITMNTVVEFNSVPFDTLYAQGGTQVQTILTDAAGCQTDTLADIYILNGQQVVGSVISVQPLSCNGANDGYAIITAASVDGNGQPNGSSINSITWVHESGAPVYGGTAIDSVLSITNTDVNGNNWVVWPGTWTAIVVDQFNCTKTFTVVIEDKALIEDDNSVLGSPSCVGLSNGSINILVKGGTLPMVNYTVTDITGTINYPTTGSVVAGLAAGTYIITVEDANGCEGTFSKALSNPAATDAVFNVNDNIKVKCYGDSTAFIELVSISDFNNNPSTAKPPYFISWELGGLGNPQNTVNTELDLPIKIENLPAGTYTVEIVDNDACQTSWVFTIGQEDSLYIQDFTVNSAFCRTGGFQNGNGSMTMIPAGGKGNHYIKWTEKATGAIANTPQWSAKNPGDYVLSLTDDNQCEAKIEFTLDSINPKGDFTISSDQFYVSDIYEGDEELRIRVELGDNVTSTFVQEGNPNSFELYQWNLNSSNINDEERWFFTFDSIARPDTTYLGVSVDEPTIYQVCLVVKNFNDCADTTCKEVKVHKIPQLILPNVFTPGGGANSPNENLFFPLVGVTEFTATVFDRYGIKVFEFMDIEDSWDGTLNGEGKECSDGVYFYEYKAITTNGTERTGNGTVTVIRSK
ncbi:MAG: gliding motility-associated C-terminal domain-containing protein [Crocinitomicaceae bacterium]